MMMRLRQRLMSRQGFLLVMMSTGGLAVAWLILHFQSRIEQVSQLGYFGALVLAFTGNSLVAIPFPWIFPVAAMGLVYSPWWIISLAVVGAAAGETVPYLVGAGVSRQMRSSALVTRLKGFSGVRKTVIVLALAFSPVLSYPGLAAGVFRYPVWATFGITLVAEGFKVWLAIYAASIVARFHLL